MAKRTYTSQSFLRIGSTQTAFSSLSDAEREAVRRRLAQQASDALSRYLSEHPEELTPLLPGKKPERDDSGL